MVVSTEWGAGEVERVMACRCVGRRLVLSDTSPVVRHVEGLAMDQSTGTMELL